jgi:hypothetical protein
LFEAFDGREEFENHQENEDESGKDRGIDIVLYTDDAGGEIREAREDDDRGHSAPDDDSDEEFNEGLIVPSSEIVLPSLMDHEDGDDSDDDLIEFEFHKCVGCLVDEAPDHSIEGLDTVPEILFMEFSHGIVGVSDGDGNLRIS